MSSNGSCASSKSNCCHHDNNTLYRPPTEGQLRWAKLHHKKRAARVQTSIRRLWLTPTTYNNDAIDHNNNDLSLDHDRGCSAGGEQRDDDMCHSIQRDPQQSVDDNNNNTDEPVGISHGRWDLLRHSQYKYEQRRKAIAVNGFRRHHSPESDNNNNNNTLMEQAAVTNHYTPVTVPRVNATVQQLSARNHPMQHRQPVIVSTHSRRNSRVLFQSAVVLQRQNQWRHPQCCTDPERDAVHSAVRNNNNSVSRQEKEDISQQQQLPLSSPKYHVRNGAWSGPLERNKNTSHTSQDEDDDNSSSVNNNSSFSFTGWGSTIVPTRPAAVRNPIVMYNQCLAPMDRSASWLVHVPTKKQKPTTTRHTITNNAKSYIMPSSYSTTDNHDRYRTTTTPQIAKLYGPLVSSSARTTRHSRSPYRRSPRICMMNEELRNDTETTTSQHRLMVVSSSSCTVMDRDVRSISDVPHMASATAVVVSPSVQSNAHGSTTTRYVAAENQVPTVILPTVTYDSDDADDDEVRDDSEDAGGILDESSIDKAVDDTFALALVLDTSLVFNESTLDNYLAPAVPFGNHHDAAGGAADSDLRRIALQPDNDTTTTTSLNRKCIVGDSIVPTKDHQKWSTSNQHAVSAVETGTSWMSSGRSGCGLSSNRHNHLQSQSIMAYDAQWERRFMM